MRFKQRVVIISHLSRQSRYFLIFVLVALIHVNSSEGGKEDPVILDYNCTDPLFVPLGSWCGPNFKLEKARLRKCAFPFDWTLSVNEDKLVDLLERDFDHFLEQEYISIVANHLVIAEYGMEFPHFSDEGINHRSEFESFYTRFSSVYKRRINRFRRLNEYRGKVVFIREAFDKASISPYIFKDSRTLNISDSSAIRLRNTLEDYFPGLDFILVIFNTVGKKTYTDNQRPSDDELMPIKELENILFYETDSPFVLLCLAEQFSN